MKQAKLLTLNAPQKTPTQLVAYVYIDQLYYDVPIPCFVEPYLEPIIKVGSMVLVQQKKTTTVKQKEKLGYVVQLAQTEQLPDTHYLLLDCVDQGKPIFNDSLLKLLKWISDYYICFPIEAIQSAIPAALRKAPKELVRLKPFELKSEPPKIVKTALRKKIISLLQQYNILSIEQLKRRTGSKAVRETLAELENTDFVEVYTEYTEPLKPKTKIAYKLTGKITDADLKQFAETFPRAKKQLESLKNILSIQEEYFTPAESGTTEYNLKSLQKKGYLTQIQIEVDTSFQESFQAEKTHQTLSQAQAEALEPIKNALNKSAFKSFLLYGITGSGKTTVYIEAIRHTLEMGKTAIMLIPEISLTPQTTARFRAFFGEEVRLMHSGLNKSEKVEAFNSLRFHKASIAIGARSAVFAPLSNVGLIIVDEEHENSYKQSELAPTYHARDVALMRSKFENAVCILGSATPSFESYTNALNQKHQLLKLKKRYNENALPKVKLLHVPKLGKASPNVSDVLNEAIQKRLEHHEQVILFINRRGFAGSIMCNDCGYIVECDYCKVPLVYHLSQNSLQCHYCGTSKILPQHCPSCNSENLAMQRSGTERLEMELAALYPDKTVERMDLDTTRKKHAHSQILSRFSKKNIDILLGTQMVTKGLDFPNVSLVGVILADIGLTLPDFRANERLFSLLTQAAGRAGRGESKGEVLLQVLNPLHPVFKFVTLQDFVAFYQEEIEFRKELFYPPFSRISKFECLGTPIHVVEQAALTFMKILRQILPMEGYQCLGPAPAALTYLKGKHRYQILLKQQPDFRLRKAWVREAMQLFRTHHKQFREIAIHLDIDAINML